MRQLVLAAAAVLAAGHAQAAARPSAAYDANCSICHQAGGGGAPGQYPRLADRVPVIASSPQGRHYLLHVVLDGLSGTVVVDGQRIVGVMPSFRQLSDADLAGILNYLAQQGAAGKRASAFTAKEVAVQRGTMLTPGQLAAERKSLAAQKLVP